MKKRVKMKGSGSCSSRPWRKQGGIEGSMWDRMESEGSGMDG